MRTVRFILFAGLILFFAGCGSVSNNMQPTPTPTPMPSPSPVASPSPVPSPSPAPATADMFLASWINAISRDPGPDGTITVDSTANNGAASTQINGLPGGGNSNFVLQFCPYPQNFSNCTNITSFMTDANNAANVNFTFPMKGTSPALLPSLTLRGSRTRPAASGKSESISNRPCCPPPRSPAA